MAPIPLHVIEKMAWLNVSPYEWKILMAIVAKTHGRRKDSAAISLSDFEKATNIRKPHVCRTLVMLEERCLIHRLSFDNVSVYSFNEDESQWRAGAIKGRADIDSAFEEWFSKYPVPLQKENARGAYFAVIMEELATPDQIMAGLDGYLAYVRARDLKFGRETDPMYIMLAHNFLKDGKYKEYATFGKVKTELDVGSPAPSRSATEKEKIYSEEREKVKAEMEASGIDPEAMRERLAELSRKFWGVE